MRQAFRHESPRKAIPRRPELGIVQLSCQMRKRTADRLWELFCARSGRPFAKKYAYYPPVFRSTVLPLDN